MRRNAVRTPMAGATPEPAADTRDRVLMTAPGTGTAGPKTTTQALNTGPGAPTARTPEQVENTPPPRKGRGEWPADDKVVGAAHGKTLREPAPRHYWSRVKAGAIKDDNSVVLPGYNEAVRHDIAGIADGRATWIPKLNRYEINGRLYGVEGSGTVFPVSGPGIEPLSRAEYGALQSLMKNGGDLSKCQKFFDNAHQFKKEPTAVPKAIELFRKYQG